MSKGWSEKSTKEIVRENPLYLHRLLSTNPAFKRSWNRKIALERRSQND